MVLHAQHCCLKVERVVYFEATCWLPHKKTELQMVFVWSLDARRHLIELYEQQSYLFNMKIKLYHDRGCAKQGNSGSNVSYWSFHSYRPISSFTLFLYQYS